MSFLDYLFPVELLVKAVIIIVLGLATILGAYFIPRGKIFVILGGIIAIVIIWFVDLGV